MAIERLVTRQFDLSGGFITEASELNLPGSVTVDEANFTIENDGSRRRRKGVDYESGYTLHTTNVWQSGDAVSVFHWNSPNLSTTVDFVVVQVGTHLHFYERGDTFSDSKQFDVVDLTSHKVSGKNDSQVRQSRVEMTAGRGKLYVVGEFIEPVEVTWDGSTINSSQVTLKERDFEGRDDGLRVDERPSSLSAAHSYNLQNQGWTNSKRDEFNTDQSQYPSNADIMFLGYSIDQSTGKRQWDSEDVKNNVVGNTRAPRGAFVRNVFNGNQIFEKGTQLSITAISVNWTDTGSENEVTVTLSENHDLDIGDTVTLIDTVYEYTNDSSATDSGNTDLQGTHVVTAITGLDQFVFEKEAPSDYQSSFSATTLGFTEAAASLSGGTFTTERPTSVAFFAGRIWYSGIADSRLGNKVYFSQVTIYEDRVGRAYQEADPTSEHDPDIVPSDGGVITIADMGRVSRMEVLGGRLYLFADNGIWAVGPGDELYFTATSFSVDKVSSVVLASPASVTAEENGPVFWAESGIYSIGADPSAGIVVQSLTRNTIQEFYTDIPDESKREAQIVYDEIDQKYYWAYSSDGANPRKYDRMLLLDVARQAFQKFTVDQITNGPFIAGLAKTKGFDDRANKVKMFTVVESSGQFTFSNFNESTFHDWKTHDGTGLDAEAFLVPGYELGDGVSRDKQVRSMAVMMKKTETGTDANGNLVNPGSVLFQGRWSWANDVNSALFAQERQIYFPRTYVSSSHPSNLEDGRPVLRRKVRPKGRGPALNMRFKTEESKDAHLLGWEIVLNQLTEA